VRAAPKAFCPTRAAVLLAEPTPKEPKSSAHEFGHPVIDGKNLIIARSFRDRVLPLRSSAIPNKTLLLHAVSF